MSTNALPGGGDYQRSMAGIASRYAPHLMLWGVLFGIGVLLLLLGVSRPRSGTLLPGGLFLVGSLGFLVPMFLGLSRTPRWAHITPHGVQWHDQNGNHHWRWEEISAVFRLDKVINKTFQVKELRLASAQREQVTFDQCLTDYDQFADRVQDTVAQRLLDAKRSELARYGAEFGPISLHRDRITIHAKTFVWPEIVRHDIVRGNLVFFPKGASHSESVPLSTVPNYTLFLQLLLELTSAPTSRAKQIQVTGSR